MDLTKSRYYKVIRATQIVKRKLIAHRNNMLNDTHKKTPQREP